MFQLLIKMASNDSVDSKEHVLEEKSESIAEGSEESFKLECDTSKLDENIQEAIYFCTDCKDFLYNDCDKFHNRVILLVFMTFYLEIIWL